MVELLSIVIHIRLNKTFQFSLLQIGILGIQYKYTLYKIKHLINTANRYKIAMII